MTDKHHTITFEFDCEEHLNAFAHILCDSSNVEDKLYAMFVDMGKNTPCFEWKLDNKFLGVSGGIVHVKEKVSFPKADVDFFSVKACKENFTITATPVLHEDQYCVEVCALVNNETVFQERNAFRLSKPSEITTKILLALSTKHIPAATLIGYKTKIVECIGNACTEAYHQEILDGYDDDVTT